MLLLSAAGAALAQAWPAKPVRMICAHTLATALPSIGVLKKAGFRQTGSGHDPGAPAGSEVVRFELMKK